LAAMEDASRILGGRKTENGINAGVLRCPRCHARLLSACAVLTEREGDEALLWVPSRPGVSKAEPATGADVTDVADELTWAECRHQWWWKIEDVSDMDSAGLSKLISSPKGSIELVVCCDCSYGPFGYRLEKDPRVWLCCDLLHQQDLNLANDAEDFQAPPGIDMSQLQAMIESGMATTQFHVTFEGQRLGMQLCDAADGCGVELNAFTELDGQIGPAELSGRIRPGDRVTRVNGRSTSSLDYAAVLDMIIDAPRPVTIHFERSGRPEGAARTYERVQHTDWRQGMTGAADRDGQG